jgi:hypothetical protein
MKTHHPLIVPSDSAWNRTTWKKYTPIWFNNFIESIKNLIDWFPVIYRDRHWDDYYIFEVLKRKLILQRKELVKSNRTTKTEEMNRYITLCLNLIERIQEEWYLMEPMEYVKIEHEFEPKNTVLSEWKSEIVWENHQGYFSKYRLRLRQLIKKQPGLMKNKMKLAISLGDLNQKRCQTLLFKILDEKINLFWD